MLTNLSHEMLTDATPVLLAALDGDWLR